MGISNPCTWFAGGGSFDNQATFTYEGGITLFHFSTKMVDDLMFDSWIPVNVVFFANNEKHAVDILIRMFEFNLECKRKQSRYYKRVKGVYHKEFLATDEFHVQAVNIILQHLRAGKITPEKAPTNQFYQVGWAVNDTIL